jgi:hypothetical protein
VVFKGDVMKKLVYPFVLWLVIAGAAQAQDAAKLAQRLVQMSGLEVQLRSVPKGFEEQMTALKGKVPDDLLFALADAGKVAYQPEMMAKEIATTLATTLKPAEMQKVIAWLETDVGRRVTIAEETSSSTMDEKSLARYAEATKAKPPSAQRQKLIQDLVEVTNSVDFGATLMEGTTLGLAIGMDSTQPVEKRVGAALLKKQIEKVMPKQQVKAVLRESMPGIYAYTYREVSDSDLKSYLAILRSEDGKRVNDAITEAFLQAMVAASLRMGQLVDQRNPKRPV